MLDPVSRSPVCRHDSCVGTGDRRDQRRWQRELEAQLNALPTYEGETPDGGDVTPLGRNLPKAPRRRRTRDARRTRGRSGDRRRTFITVGITLAVIIGFFGASLTSLVEPVRGLLGFGDRGEESTYAFLASDTMTGRPYTWSSCDPIRYVVNPGRAPDGWEKTLDEAIDEVSDATGLEFVDEGTTTDGADSSRIGPGDKPRPVLIGWADADEVSDLKGDIVGVAGPQSLGDVFVTGTVFLDATAFAVMEDRGQDGLERAVIMHELGHLVGLDHVDDDRQLMYPSTTFQTSFGNGDKEGLKILGDGPCR